MNIEGIVRPFQTVNVFASAARRGPVDPVPGAVLLELGKNASPKTFTGSFSLSTSGFIGKKQIEKRRLIQPVDVKNPDDPEQKIRLNSVQQLDSKSGRGRNFEHTKRTYNKKGELHQLTDVEKIGGEIELKEIT